MSITLDKPGIIIDDFIDDDNQLGGADDFPDAVVMIHLGNEKYAAVNTTTSGPDPMTVNLLATFMDTSAAEKWGEAQNLTGEYVDKKFEEARNLAISKPSISGLGLQVNGVTSKIHWVR